MKTDRHIISAVIRNKPGTLDRITGLFNARGYNIDSLTVGRAASDKYREAEIDDGGISRLTVVTRTTDPEIEQILAQLEKLVNVIEVCDLTNKSTHVETDITLLKLTVSDLSMQANAVTIAEKCFRAICLITREDALIFRFPGREDASEAFVKTMRRFGPVESVYSGTIAIA